jgi:uncharacterized protein (TIGR03790 family)
MMRLGRRELAASILGLGAALAVGCRPAEAVSGAPPASVDPRIAKVLVVANARSEDSVAIANHYARRRRMPAVNVCLISCTPTEEIEAQAYANDIEKPVRAYIAAHKLAPDYIVLTKGIPIRIHGTSLNGLSTDGLIATMEIPDLRSPARNPYYASTERFSHERFAIYLVTRLDGYTRADCLRLVDSALAATPLKGMFLLHTGPGHNDGGYRIVNESMKNTAKLLRAKGLDATCTTDDAFPGDKGALAGYFSWGSNDGKFDKAAYRATRFADGAIADTAVSTSGRTFANPDAPGQSLIADLIKQGVTGCKGYVSEPYVEAIAVPEVLFDRYTSGFNLAESFYAASRYIHWKDVVIGDPLCAPYAK